MVKVEEFHSTSRRSRSYMGQERDFSLEYKINVWLRNNPKIKVIDIKYTVHETTDAALILYEPEE